MSQLTVFQGRSLVMHSQPTDYVLISLTHLSIHGQRSLWPTQSSHKQYPPCWTHAQWLLSCLEASHPQIHQI